MTKERLEEIKADRRDWSAACSQTTASKFVSDALDDLIAHAEASIDWHRPSCDCMAEVVKLIELIPERQRSDALDKIIQTVFKPTNIISK